MTELLERDFSSFFDAPFHAYAADTPYVSPMKADLKRFLSIENPLFSDASEFTFFSVKQYGKPVGRITAHIHRGSNNLHREARGCFGYFDCVNNPEVATVLLQAAENWTRAKGMTRLVGNFNLTAMQQVGIMTDGFDQQPFTDQIWGPPHLPGLLEENGFQPHFPMTTFERRLDTNLISEVLPDAQRTQLFDQGFSFAPVNRATIDERLEDARAILNRSFKNNPMFVPVSAEEFHFQAKDMKWIMDPRISKVVHFKGAPAGALIAIPDLNPLLRRIKSRLRLSLPYHYLRYKARRDRAVVIFQGVMPEFQGRSINPLMLQEMTRDMVAAGYKTVGGTWIADENTASLRQTEKAGASPLHRLHLFSKELV
jgi:GNAT superfamily N-acetyltransferase